MQLQWQPTAVTAAAADAQCVGTGAEKAALITVLCLCYAGPHLAAGGANREAGFLCASPTPSTYGRTRPAVERLCNNPIFIAASRGGKFWTLNAMLPCVLTVGFAGF